MPGDEHHEQQQQRIVINFIDPLFAVVLNVSFAQIYTEGWFVDFKKIFTMQNGFHVGTLLVGYSALILSWVGYHQSISKYPIHVDRFWGRARFIFDVALLITYFILLVSYANFERFLWAMVFVYLMFFAWDLSKTLERTQVEIQAGTVATSPERRGVTVVWLFAQTVLALMYSCWPPSLRYRYKDWLCLLLLCVFTFVYRLHKEYLWGSSLLRRIAIGPTT